MSEKIKTLIRQTIRQVIASSVSSNEIRQSFEIHDGKIHFVPVQYRVIGGILQSLNIKFGNFLEKLMRTIADIDPNLELHRYSGQRMALKFSSQTDTAIDNYVTSRQVLGTAYGCEQAFETLQKTIIENERKFPEKQTIKKDIDCLFKTKKSALVYLEVKYNDDHDTGKYADINRKFIKTYAGLANELKIRSEEELRPILYYFNKTTRWTNIYCPDQHVMRGPQLFEEYFATKFDDVDSCLSEIGEDDEVLSIFDGFYKKVREQK